MKKLLNSNLPCYTLPPTQHRSSLETDPLLKCYLWPRYLISKGTHVKFARFAEHELYIFTLCKRRKKPRRPPPPPPPNLAQGLDPPLIALALCDKRNLAYCIKTTNCKHEINTRFLLQVGHKYSTDVLSNSAFLLVKEGFPRMQWEGFLPAMTYGRKAIWRTRNAV